MWKVLTAASTAIALIGTPALADWDLWDADDDAFVSPDEFNLGFGEGTVYDDWDADDDALLTEDEWGAGWGEEYDEEEVGLFSDWDANEDAFVDETEFNEGVFGMYDEDADAMWSEDEYVVYEDDGWF